MSQDPSSPLAGRRVAVIGGASGIGFAVAALAQARGARVVIGSRVATRVEAAARRLGCSGAEVVDLRDEASVVRFFERLGALDHLAVTAGDWGGAAFVPARALDLAAARDAFEVRFWGALGAAREAAGRLSEGGSITLTGGLLGQHPMRAAPLVSAIAGAVEHLARGLAVDLAPVRVNAVSPGLVLTEHVSTQMPPELIGQIVARQPLPRAATPREAAQAYVYLMENAYVTGQVLSVDGGSLLV